MLANKRTNQDILTVFAFFVASFVRLKKEGKEYWNVLIGWYADRYTCPLGCVLCVCVC